MRVKTWVELSDEVEVEVSSAQIVDAMLDGVEDCPSGFTIKRYFNNFAAFLNGLTAEQLEALEPDAREIIHSFCVRQAARFASRPEAL